MFIKPCVWCIEKNGKTMVLVRPSIKDCHPVACNMAASGRFLQWWMCCAMGGRWGRCDNLGPLGRRVLSHSGAQMYMWGSAELQNSKYFPLIHQNKTVHVREYLCTCSLLALDCIDSFFTIFVSVFSLQSCLRFTVRVCWTDMKELCLCKSKGPLYKQHVASSTSSTLSMDHHRSWQIMITGQRVYFQHWQRNCSIPSVVPPSPSHQSYSNVQHSSLLHQTPSIFIFRYCQKDGFYP